MSSVNELKMSPDLMPAVLAGYKRITIRRGKREFERDITINGEPAEVTSYYHFKLKDVPLIDLLDDGFSSFSHTLETLQKFYPDMTDESEVTVVRFFLEKHREAIAEQERTLIGGDV